jgi:hypothetical protein
VALAIAATRELRSYAYAAATTLAAKKPVHTRILGRFVRGQGIAYRFVVDGKRSDVVRTRNATYVRRHPGGWSRLRHPKTALDPTASLLAVLRGFEATGLTHTDGTTRLDGKLPVEALKRADLPEDGASADAHLLLDARHRIVGVVISSGATVGTRAVTVTIRSSYSRFGHVAPVRRPV